MYLHTVERKVLAVVFGLPHFTKPIVSFELWSR